MDIVASDIPAFLPYTREVVFLEDGEVARIEGAKWQVFSLADLSPVKKSVSHVPWDMQAAPREAASTSCSRRSWSSRA